MNQDKLIALFSQARLNVKITNKYKESVYIAIEPNKIINFLDDLIVSFDKDLISYAEKVGTSAPPPSAPPRKLVDCNTRKLKSPLKFLKIDILDSKKTKRRTKLLGLGKMG